MASTPDIFNRIDCERKAVCNCLSRAIVVKAALARITTSVTKCQWAGVAAYGISEGDQANKVSIENAFNQMVTAARTDVISVAHANAGTNVWTVPRENRLD